MNIKNIRLEVIQSDINALDVETKITECSNHDQETIRTTIAQALLKAQDNGQKSLSFSDLNCEDKVFPVVGLAKIMVQEIMSYARNYDQPSLERIVFCLKNDQVFQIFDKTVRNYLRHLQETLGFGPYTTVDIIIEMEEGIVLIERSNPPYGWALPGGFLDYGESLEQTAVREAKEETNLTLEDLRQFHTYSEPSRDPRFHTIATVFTAKGVGTPHFGDDAKGLKIVKRDDLLGLDYAFDHKQIINDYLKKRY